jgi:regulator of Ty1 transposition protein 109
MKEAWGQTITGTKVIEVQNVAGTAGINTLNTGLVRKKRKDGAEEVKDTPSVPPNVTSPQVNVLSAGMIRKKAKV